jgi:hypothetical protein
MKIFKMNIDFFYLKEFNYPRAVGLKPKKIPEESSYTLLLLKLKLLISKLSLKILLNFLPLKGKINSLYLLPFEGGGLKWGWSRGSIHQTRIIHICRTDVPSFHEGRLTCLFYSLRPPGHGKFSKNFSHSNLLPGCTEKKLPVPFLFSYLV